MTYGNKASELDPSCDGFAWQSRRQHTCRALLLSIGHLVLQNKTGELEAWQKCYFPPPTGNGNATYYAAPQLIHWITSKVRAILALFRGLPSQVGSCCSALVQQCSFQGAAQGAGHSCVLCHLDGRYSSITCSATISISHCCAGASQLVSTTATPSPRSLNALLPQMSSGFFCMLASP